MLVVAGSLKRSDRERPEDEVLMRALRDFNIPKIVTDDVPVFMGLIGDLFPALEVPRKRDMDFEALVKKSALVSRELFIKKVFLSMIHFSLALYAIESLQKVNRSREGDDRTV